MYILIYVYTVYIIYIYYIIRHNNITYQRFCTKILSVKTRFHILVLFYFPPGCCGSWVVHSHYIYRPLQRKCKPRYWEAQPRVSLLLFGEQRSHFDQIESQQSPLQEVGGRRRPGDRRGHWGRKQPWHQHHAHRFGPHQAAGRQVGRGARPWAATQWAERRGAGGGGGDGGGGTGWRAADRPHRCRHRPGAEVQAEGCEGGTAGGGAGSGERVGQHGAHVSGEDAGLPQQLGGLRLVGRATDKGERELL